jgi:hypothetical protein
LKQNRGLKIQRIPLFPPSYYIKLSLLNGTDQEKAGDRAFASALVLHWQWQRVRRCRFGRVENRPFALLIGKGSG